MDYEALFVKYNYSAQRLKSIYRKEVFTNTAELFDVTHRPVKTMKSCNLTYSASR